MNAERWEQESGAAVAERLVVASMACLTVWHLREDRSAAGERRRVLVRLSGRQMKHRVESTPPRCWRVWRNGWRSTTYKPSTTSTRYSR